MTGSLFASIVIGGALTRRPVRVARARDRADHADEPLVANFAQGDMGMFSAFLLLMIFLPLGLPLWLGWGATSAGLRRHGRTDLLDPDSPAARGRPPEP